VRRIFGVDAVQSTRLNDRLDNAPCPVAAVDASARLVMQGGE
jgi:hypothetical protein